jgi:hypothetical protein
MVDGFDDLLFQGISSYAQDLFVSPHAENVAYMIQTAWLSNSIFTEFTTFHLLLLWRRRTVYYMLSVATHSNNTESVLEFTHPYPSTTPGAKVSIQRSRLLMVRENASLTCKAYSA